MGSEIRTARRIWSFVSGALLYLSALGLAHSLASQRWPLSLQSLLGGSGSWTLQLAQAVLIAVLLYGMAWIWAYYTVRPQRGHSRHPTTAWCLGGMGLAWLLALLAGVLEVSSRAGGYQPSLTGLLLSSTVPPLWGSLNGVAVLLAILSAGRWSARLRRRRKARQSQLNSQLNSQLSSQLDSDLDSDLDSELDSRLQRGLAGAPARQAA
ncbi:hypothetical protein [Paucibacter sp. B51]|uniref:hypothetical protein n=1 Tax=Paucibacter sp. B51 TaxID=2993315 RepID=UPI0022EBD51F|nr:hypothetical protein [Paucibacter sp. B51]